MDKSFVPTRSTDDGRKPRKSWIVPLLAWGFGSLATVGVIAFLVVAYFLIDIVRALPSSEVMNNYEPAVTTRVHAGDGSLIAEFAKERRLFVPLEGIPDQLEHAFLSAEDKNFYDHAGVDPYGILRAVIANIDNYRNNRRLEGASTITQQVARNFLLSSEVSYNRKIKEALIALRMEQTFSKEHILELYLNEIYLGWRSYGVAAAALNYFDKSLEELTLAEAAYLAALPKAPNNYHPIDKKSRAMARRNYVLDRMRVNGYISREQEEAAKQEDLVVHQRAVGTQVEDAQYFAEEVRRQLYDLYGEEGLYMGGLSVRSTVDTSFQQKARKALRYTLELYDRRHGWRGPFTTIDLQADDWQAQLSGLETLPLDLSPWKAAVVLSLNGQSASIGFLDGSTGELPFSGMKWARKWLKRERVGAPPSRVSDVVAPGDVVFVERISGEDSAEAEAVSDENPPADSYYALRQIPAVDGGIVVMDPHTGRVLAMVGGFSFQKSEFNRATQAMRQPGSSFKPFVYAAALDSGYTPSTIVLDGPLVVVQGPGLPLWKPKNYSSKFYGESTLRIGIEHSRNLMTARLALDIGMEPIVLNAGRFGIRTEKNPLDPRPAMALGAGETTLYRMVAAYSMLVNGGKSVQPTVIDRIQDRYGKSIYRHDERPCDRCIQDQWNGQAPPSLKDEREQVADPGTAYQIVSMLEGAVLRGTGTAMRSIGIPLAGKTGTTNESRDAWFIGMTPDMVVGAYVGFDTPRSLGPRETGGRVALPAVKRFFEQVVEETVNVPFRIPSSIRLVRVNRKTGLLTTPDDPRMILEAFKPGTEPTSSRPQQRIRIEDEYEMRESELYSSNAYEYEYGDSNYRRRDGYYENEDNDEEDTDDYRYRDRDRTQADRSSRPAPPSGPYSDSPGGLY